MMVRIADYTDSEQILKLVRQFHLESPYKDTPFLYEKFDETLEFFLSDLTRKSRAIFLLDDTGVSKGFLAAICQEMLFNRDLIASEMAWYILPEYRNNGGGIALLRTFEDWAYLVNAKIVHMSDLDGQLEDFYNSQGYTLVERTYVKCLS